MCFDLGNIEIGSILSNKMLNGVCTCSHLRGYLSTATGERAFPQHPPEAMVVNFTTFEGGKVELIWVVGFLLR